MAKTSSLRLVLETSALMGANALAAASASAQTAQPINVPAQPAEEAVTQLSKQTGVPISALRRDLEGKTSVSVTGPMSAKMALATLLDDPELTILQGADGGLLVTRNSSLNFVSQDATEDPFDLGTIVLRGELIEREVQDSRTSAVVLDGEALESGVSTDFSESIERTPGITNTGESIAIRGIVESPNGISGERTINVQVDGATFGVSTRLNSTDFSTWDLEQVEILRGPQSTQTGRNALAGAIVVRSRDPQYFQEARVKLRYASFDTGQAAIALNTPLIDDRLALRFSYDFVTTDGEISNPNPAVDEVDSEEKKTTRLGLRWDPTDQLSAVLKFSRLEVEDGTLIIDPDRLPDFVNTADEPSREDAELDSVNLRVTYNFDSAWSLVSSTSFSDFESFGSFDLDGTSAPGGIAEFIGDSDWFEQEFTLNYVTDRTSAVLGAYYYSENSTNTGIVPAIPINTTLDEDVENYAVFGEVEHAFTDEWSIIAGFRYDVEEGDVDQVDVVGGFPILSSSDYSFDAFLPKVGLVYSFDETTSLGFIYQQGYRSGGVGINRLAQTNEFDPEFTDNYELSFRSEFYDGNLIVNANAFYTEWTDRQVRVNNPPFTNPSDTRIENLGSAERYGFELDVRAQPTDNLSLYGGLAYVEDESIFPQADPTAGNRVTTSEETTAAFGGLYNFDENWYVGGSINYTNPLGDNDARTLVDAQVGFRQNNWSAYVFATNVFDEEYTLGGAVRGSSRRIGVVLEASF